MLQFALNHARDLDIQSTYYKNNISKALVSKAVLASANTHFAHLRSYTDSITIDVVESMGCK